MRDFLSAILLALIAYNILKMFDVALTYEPETLCVFGVGYCTHDEEQDERAGFHRYYNPPLHMMWCSCVIYGEE